MQEKERKKEEEKEEKMRRTRVDTKCHAKPVWCWALWWCLVLSLVGGSRSPWFFWRVFGGPLDLHPLGGNVGPHGTQKGQEEKP